MMHCSTISCIWISLLLSLCDEYENSVGYLQMATFELVRYLNDNADELIGKAEASAPTAAEGLLNEAEELMALSASILCRYESTLVETKEAA